MTPDDALKIINYFHGSIKDNRPYSIFQSSKNLPNTAGRIKHAHYVLGEAFLNKDELTAKTAKYLMESYGLIDLLFVEDPEDGNEQYKGFIAQLREGNLSSFRIPNPYGDINQVLEYRNFLGEIIFISKKDVPLLEDSGQDILDAAFVYDQVYSKALKERDIKTIRGLVNSSLTRTVLYPDRKTNKDCIFI